MTHRPPGPTAVIRRAMRDRPGSYLSAHTLITITGLSPDKVNVALTALLKRGEIDRLFTGVPQGERQAYRWIH